MQINFIKIGVTVEIKKLKPFENWEEFSKKPKFNSVTKLADSLSPCSGRGSLRSLIGMKVSAGHFFSTCEVDGVKHLATINTEKTTKAPKISLYKFL